jgi:hypothetical protein
MKKKWITFSLLLGGMCALPLIWLLKANGPEKTSAIGPAFPKKATHSSYFAPVPISKFTSANQPCIEIQIGNAKISSMLDLGFRGQFGLSPELLEKIEDKKFLNLKTMYGAKGNEYVEKVYEIPKACIGKMTFSDSTFHEYTDKYSQDSTLHTSGYSSREPCRIGWELFGNTNLLVDLKGDKIAFCDSINTLKAEGYSVEKFIKTSLFVDRGLLEFDVEIPTGKLRCVLDTGCTWNILNTSDQVESQEVSLFINKVDFGLVNFHPLSIKLPIHIEAILGMEFLEDRTLFIDFSEHYIYFSTP